MSQFKAPYPGQQPPDYTQPQSYYPSQQQYRPLPRQLPLLRQDWAYAIRVSAIAIVLLFGGGLYWWFGLPHVVSTVTAPTITQPTAAPGWSIAQSFSGNGAKQTEVFAVPQDWRIVWACAGFANGASGSLFVNVMGANNAYIAASAVNADCPSGTTTSDSTEEHQGGSIYLNVIAAGQWVVQVQVPNR